MAWKTSRSAEAILGFLVYDLGLKDLVDEIAEWVRVGSGCRWLACMNPGSYAIAVRRVEFAQAVRACDWLIPDGAGMVLASRTFGGRIRSRITGADLFHGVCERLSAQGGARVFFLGATEETLAAIARRLAVDYPGLVLAGTYSPPFRDSFSAQEVEEMLEAVQRGRPDVLWVGMTSPKQDLWIRDNRDKLAVKFAAGIGAVFDFYSGRIPRAGKWAQRLGMEWVVRAWHEPRRMLLRSVTAIPVFLSHLLVHRFLKHRTAVRP